MSSPRSLLEVRVASWARSSSWPRTMVSSARTLPHLLHSIEADESVRAELTMVLGSVVVVAQDHGQFCPRGLVGLDGVQPAWHGA
ncbi:hypothetical protein, partial [Streptomyces scabiei]|uniref:hypothetical protein n=1 Tax=Streptomyces scabiei TaxID=1930 RepID=UPI00211AE4DB